MQLKDDCVSQSASSLPSARCVIFRERDDLMPLWQNFIPYTGAKNARRGQGLNKRSNVNKRSLVVFLANGVHKIAQERLTGASFISETDVDRDQEGKNEQRME
ncbi:hypothetical protein KIN20_007895 [Parelaphostrongylus tenuis]|uniref:Uncharacterized protein n=1 Tax=Parelaphostrongylus tenuis TaxID=148309 RepID=A0AAD5QJG0_PARTN|nr:hypothetical protein KIN20_007895 [Parelaphostrongylus tenuis]